jgi:hypothetical protein
VSNSALRIILTPSRAAGVLAVASGLLLLAHLLVIFVRVELGHPHFFGINRLFDVNLEANIPTLFSTSLFLINGALLFLAGKADRNSTNPFVRYCWMLLALVFLFLALDEGVALHETLMRFFRRHLHTDGVFHFAWVIPYGLATILLGFLTWPWFQKLDARTRWLFGASAVLFVAGAIGMEMVNGRYLESINLVEDLTYHSMIMLEESLEMGGLILFSYSLLDFIERQEGIEFTVAVRRKAAEVAVAAEARVILTAAGGRVTASENPASPPRR